MTILYGVGVGSFWNVFHILCSAQGDCCSEKYEEKQSCWGDLIPARQAGVLGKCYVLKGA